jgi:hypothetical protein
MLILIRRLALKMDGSALGSAFKNLIRAFWIRPLRATSIRLMVVMKIAHVPNISLVWIRASMIKPPKPNNKPSTFWISE